VAISLSMGTFVLEITTSACGLLVMTNVAWYQFARGAGSYDSSEYQPQDSERLFYVGAEPSRRIRIQFARSAGSHGMR